MKRFDDEFDWHADQKRGALARMVDRLLEVLRRSFLDHRRRRIEDPANYQTTGWLLVLGIASFCVVIVLKWFWI